ncbi:hypothetical protein QUA00_06985 [Microcoleus sp. T2B6]|uniref:hypothetical protein n=1 Tax=Microcoleus sp. T2B6 TaxID=3055424 RepID=UPI002FCE8EBE
MPVRQEINVFVGLISATGKMPVPQEINVFVGLILATGKMPVPQEINVFVGSRGWASCPPRSPLWKMLSHLRSDKP